MLNKLSLDNKFGNQI